MIQSAFLDDIVTHPDDDTPRLIYADWLEDHGDAARAELIRVQIRRLALPEDAWEQRDLAGIEADLLEQHGERWRAELPTLDGIEWGAFSRGFVWEVRARTEVEFLPHVDAIFDAAPIRQLKLHAVGPGSVLSHFASLPHLERITQLDLGNGAIPDFRLAQTLLASSRLGSLHTLLLHGNPLGDDVMGLIAHAHLPHLKELYLSGCGITELGVARLADEPILPHLGVLDLRDNSLNDGTIRHLSRWACARSLHTLYLVNNRLGPTSAEDLSWRLPHLERLYLNHNAIDEPGAEALAASALPSLRELDVRYGDIRDRGLLALARSPLAARLTQMWLMAGNPMNLRTTLAELRRLLGPRLAG